MASNQGNYDNSANAPYWAADSVHLRANTTNAGLVYDNTTQDAFYRPKGVTVGLFAVDDAEKIVEGNTGSHAGWVLRTTGTGGRAGRVQEETLSVVASFRSDNNADDAVYPDASIVITQPVTLRTVNSNTSAANVVTFSVAGTKVTPANAVVTYQWQVNNNIGGSWVNIDAGTDVSTGQPGGAHKTGATTDTLSIAPTDTTANNYVFRAVVTATNPNITNSSTTVYSSNGRIYIPA
jgi:hypothetical protein